MKRYRVGKRNYVQQKRMLVLYKRQDQTWALEIHRKLVDLEDRSRRKNLRILGIKEDLRDSWEECENKIYDLMEEKLVMDTSNITIEINQTIGCIVLEKNRTIKKGQ